MRFALLLLLLVTAPAAWCQNESQPLRFQFAGTPWREVLQYVAESGNLALQMNTAPPGTLTFADPDRTYTVPEGLDLLNRLLLDRGWAIVRRGRLLFVIDLEAENAEKFVSEMAELVTPEDFDTRGDSDIVRCVFPMVGLTADQAKEELTQLIGPWGRVTVLAASRQIVVTETVGRLKTIRDVLDSARTATTAVVEFPLAHRSADEVLDIARPLLGLAADINAGEDIRLSTSIAGDKIYAAGSPNQLSLLESVVKKADAALPGDETTGEPAAPVLQTHSVLAADLDTAFNVLQTMLAGVPGTRIDVDTNRGAVIVLATPATQTLVAQTIAELDGGGGQLAIIDLKRLEPTQALLTIQKYFGVTAESPGNGPVVDGDPVTGRLWVRGSERQIEETRRLIDQLESGPGSGSVMSRMRILPIGDGDAAKTLEQLRRLWPMVGPGNRLEIRQSSRGDAPSGAVVPPKVNPAASPTPRSGEKDAAQSSPPSPRFGERGMGGEGWSDPDYVAASNAPGPLTPRPPLPEAGRGGEVFGGGFLVMFQPPTAEATPDPPPVYIDVTDGSLVVASDDPAALDAIEELLATLSGVSAAPAGAPTLFWLKFIKADVAAELVSGVLGGAAASDPISSLAETVVGGLGGGMLGGLMGGGGDASATENSSKTIQTARGSVNLVADNRLNALIVQAPPADLALIRSVLQEIDVEESPETVQTGGRPGLIPVIYQDASAVAEIVKTIYEDKIKGTESSSGGGDSGRGGGGSPADFFAALRGGGSSRGGRGGGESEVKKPKSEPVRVRVAVDERSNSLVVTASPQDFADIERLVEAIDQQGEENEQTVEVLTVGGGVAPEVMRQALQSVLGKEIATTATSSSSGGSASRSGSSSSDSDSADRAAEIQRRIEMFRSGAFGGGPGRGGDSGRGGGESSRGQSSRGGRSARGGR